MIKFLSQSLCVVILVAVAYGRLWPSKDDLWQFVMHPGDEVLIGRGLDCDVTLASRGVSGHHALLRCRPAQIAMNARCRCRYIAPVVQIMAFLRKGSLPGVSRRSLTPNLSYA